MSATYAKLRDGSWGLRVTGAAPAPGTALSVRKKSGETKTETVGRVIWTGNGVALCAIRTNAGRGGYSSGGSAYCGYPCPVTGRKCCAANGPCHDCA